MKKDFIWFLANIYILANKKEFNPFIKENENIYQGKSRLLGNYGFGLAVTLIWLIVLSGLSDDLINEFADVIKAIKEKEDRIIFYFTNSFLVTAAICDHCFKWTREKITF